MKKKRIGSLLSIFLSYRMEEVGLSAKGQESETRLQTARPHAGVQLLIEMKRRERDKSD